MLVIESAIVCATNEQGLPFTMAGGNIAAEFMHVVITLIRD